MDGGTGVVWGDLFAWVCGRILPWSFFVFLEFEDFGMPQRPRNEIPRFWAYSETLLLNLRGFMTREYVSRKFLWSV